MAERIPRVGELVHYYTGDEEHGIGVFYHPAVITRVISNTCVNLQVFLDDDGMVRRHDSRMLTDKPKTGWRWPPPEEPAP